MIPSERQRRLERWLALTRPNAKFVAISHSEDFIDPGAELGAGFIYVNLYDEQVDANLARRDGAMVMIHNTYLSSFAYNLFLCWLYGHSTREGPGLDRLLAHNFKKFFAEQLWRQWNDTASRALLLETLLYEQVCMIPVFAAQSRDQALSKASNDAASLMSLALSMHELGHFTLDSRPGARQEFLAETKETAAPILDRAARMYPETFLDEVRCDMIAVVSCLRRQEERSALLFSLRVLVFSFAAYAAMFSLVKSAGAHRARRQAEPAEEIDLRSIEKTHRDHVIPIGMDNDFVERARLVTELCQRIADTEGMTLFGTDGSFPLPETIAGDLMAYVRRVLECDDSNARAMANLVAEALHGHDAGMEYLYLRSKTFRSQRELPSRV